MTTHHFTPIRYHTAIGAHEPVLRIADGDTVITATVDAMGKDASDSKATPGGNPMTGPFYIEGAEPGDTLVLHLDRITPNRATGWTSQMLASNVVDPTFVSELFRHPKDAGWEPAIWEIDLAAGTATLSKPE